MFLPRFVRHSRANETRSFLTEKKFLRSKAFFASTLSAEPATSGEKEMPSSSSSSLFDQWENRESALLFSGVPTHTYTYRAATEAIFIGFGWSGLVWLAGPSVI